MTNTFIICLDRVVSMRSRKYFKSSIRFSNYFANSRWTCLSRYSIDSTIIFDRQHHNSSISGCVSALTVCPNWGCRGSTTFKNHCCCIFGDAPEKVKCRASLLLKICRYTKLKCIVNHMCRDLIQQLQTSFSFGSIRAISWCDTISARPLFRLLADSEETIPSKSGLSAAPSSKLE